MATMKEALLYPGRSSAPRAQNAPQGYASSAATPDFGFQGYTPSGVGFGALRGLVTGGVPGAVIGGLASGLGFTPSSQVGTVPVSTPSGTYGFTRRTANMPGAVAIRGKVKRDRAEGFGRKDTGGGSMGTRGHAGGGSGGYGSPF